MMAKYLWFVLIMVSVLAANATESKVQAEVVQLKIGLDRFGQGWLFQDSTGDCRVVTARHVVQEQGGQLVAPTLIDRRGRESATQNPVLPDKSLDIAFLQVAGSLAEEGCTTSYLPTGSLDLIVRQNQAATLVVMRNDEEHSISLNRAAIGTDDEAGKVIAFEASTGTRLSQGMSGGTIFLGDRPIALLFQVDSDLNVGVAIRFDIIAERYGSVSFREYGDVSSDARLLGLEALTLSVGTTFSQEASLGDFVAGKGPLKIRTRNRSIQFVAKRKPEENAREISMQFASGTPAPESMIVEVRNAATPTGYTFIRACDFGDSSNLFRRCAFPPIKFAHLRLTLIFSDTSDVTVERFAVK